MRNEIFWQCLKGNDAQRLSRNTASTPQRIHFFLICLQNVNMFIKLNISASKAGSFHLWEGQGAGDDQQAAADTRRDPDGRTATHSVTGRHVYSIIINH